MYAYPEGCVVVDNPPFSILQEVVRWYMAQGIAFFLFAPTLTVLNGGSKRADAALTCVVCNSDVLYRNGGIVKTSFYTNMLGDLRIWVCPRLAERITDASGHAQREKSGNRKHVYPRNVATIGALLHSDEVKIARSECAYVRTLEEQRAENRKNRRECRLAGRDTSGAFEAKVFGGGFLLSDAAAARLAEAKRSWLRREAYVWELSARERAVVDHLNAQSAGAGAED